MSIWSTYASIDGLYETGHQGPPADPIPESYLEFATAIGHYGKTGLRIRLEAASDSHGEWAVLSREQVAEVIRSLQRWLEESAGWWPATPEQTG